MKKRLKDVWMIGKMTLIRTAVVILFYNELVRNSDTLNPIVTKVRPIILTIRIILFILFILDMFWIFNKSKEMIK